MPSKHDLAFEIAVEAEKSRLEALTNEQLVSLPEYQSSTVFVNGVSIFLAAHHDTSHEGFRAFVVQAERKLLIGARCFVSGFILTTDNIRLPLPQNVIYEYS